MTDQTILLILACCTTAHFVMTCALAVYARHRVQYLALTWILGIFTALMGICIPFSDHINGNPGILHPLMLLTLTSICFLQSLYPISIPLPAYLQWGRMWKYASPAICLYSVYGIAMLLGLKPLHLNSFSDLAENWYSIDIWLRLTALGLGVYYVQNILRLPSRIAHSTELPTYLKGYCSALGISVLFYLYTAISYNPIYIVIYLIGFSLLNLYLCFRTFETMAMELPKPVIAKVKEPKPEALEQAENEDYNEANRQRFQRIEYWMQTHREEWTKSTFNRDALCEQVGINRHLVLQCVRSQGYNSTHDYLNTYRFEELKRLIQRGKVKSATEAVDAGFGTPKTARSVFMNLSGQPLDEYLALYKETSATNNTKTSE